LVVSHVVEIFLQNRKCGESFVYRSLNSQDCE